MAFDKNHTSLAMKIVIIVFAVILVATMCLPFFSGCSSTTANTAADTADTSTADTASSSSTSTVAGVQAQYKTLMDSLTNRYESDPTNPTYVVSLANNYMDCASAMNSADDAADNADTVKEAFTTAIGYYDEYLKLAADSDAVQQSDISSVTVDRAVCLFYAGSEDEAVSALETFLDQTPDYAMGWYNLGAFYEQQGDTTKAKEAYNKVLEVDPDGQTSASSYASLRLMIIQASEEAATTDATTDADATDTATDTDATDASAATTDGETADGASTSASDTSGSESDTTGADASAK